MANPSELHGFWCHCIKYQREGWSSHGGTLVLMVLQLLTLLMKTRQVGFCPSCIIVRDGKRIYTIELSLKSLKIHGLVGSFGSLLTFYIMLEERSSGVRTPDFSEMEGDAFEFCPKMVV